MRQPPLRALSTSCAGWAIAISVACAPDEPGADDETSPCETLWQPDEGVDYGEPWDPPTVQDLPDIKLDVLPDEAFELDVLNGADQVEGATFVGLPAVEGWEFEGTHGVYFRRVTKEEMAEYGWKPGDILMVMPDLIDAIGEDIERLVLPLPFYESRGTSPGRVDILSVVLQYAGEFRPAAIVDRDQRPSQPKRRPVSFSYYAPAGLPSGTHILSGAEVHARLTSDHDDAISVRGTGLGRTFSARGPIDDRMLSFSAPLDQPVYVFSSALAQDGARSFSVMRPSASAADVVTDDEGLDQCSDGLDNDGDGTGDECDYECHTHPDFAGPGGVEPALIYENSKSFGMFGDLLYCSAAADFWELELATIGFEASQFLNWVDGGEPDELNAFRHVVVACDVRGPDEASACHDTGICAGSLSDYPLAGVGHNLYRADNEPDLGYVDLAWATADWYISNETAVPPMHAVVIAAQQNDPPGNFGTAGSAFANLADIDYGKVGGAAVNVVAGAPHLRVAHELGHTMGLPHDTATYIREGDPSQLQLPGFMNAGGGTQPVLGEPDPEENWWGRNAQGVDVYQPKAIWTESVPEPNWPRSSGFGHTGCEEQTCEYFPNLTCNGFVCAGPLE